MDNNYPEIRKTGMKWVILYFIGLFAFAQLLAGCGNPGKALNFITPDRLGIGMSQGNMNAFGESNKFMKNQPNAMEIDFRGDTDAINVWLEWDFPSWSEPSDYDRFLRERVRTLQLEKTLLVVEKSLKKQNEVIEEKEKTIERIDRQSMWPYKLTDQYGTGGA